jgi:hypothetical protein
LLGSITANDGVPAVVGEGVDFEVILDRAELFVTVVADHQAAGDLSSGLVG